MPNTQEDGAAKEHGAKQGNHGSGRKEYLNYVQWDPPVLIYK